MNSFLYLCRIPVGGVCAVAAREASRVSPVVTVSSIYRMSRGKLLKPICMVSQNYELLFTTSCWPYVPMGTKRIECEWPHAGHMCPWARRGLGVSDLMLALCAPGHEEDWVWVTSCWSWGVNSSGTLKQTIIQVENCLSRWKSVFLADHCFWWMWNWDRLCSRENMNRRFSCS